eukprot:366066-Chlamydomonas_euryale.AAC.1
MPLAANAPDNRALPERAWAAWASAQCRAVRPRTTCDVSVTLPPATADRSHTHAPHAPAVRACAPAQGVAEINDGAMCVFVDGHKIPLIIQKSDGGFGYASTDMAALKHRLTTEHADWIIYVTDVGQSSHFEMVFAAARKAGWLATDGGTGARVSHVGFGLVLGEDGKRMKTRSGDTVRLVELLDEARAK